MSYGRLADNTKDSKQGLSAVRAGMPVSMGSATTIGAGTRRR